MKAELIRDKTHYIRKLRIYEYRDSDGLSAINYGLNGDI